MSGVLAAARAELGQFKPVRRVAAVLLRDVVPLFAVHACERDLGADVSAFARHGGSPTLSCTIFVAHMSCSLIDAGTSTIYYLHMCSGSGTRTRDTAIMSRLLYHLSYPAMQDFGGIRAERMPPKQCRAPKGNRTLGLLLTMETLCRLSYRGSAD